MTAAVAVTDVWRSFGKQTVLAGVTLTTAPGQVVAIYGRSGSGKTTLVNLVGGLDQPTRGTIAIDGVDLSTLSATALSELRRTHMGFVFQSYGLLAHLSAWDNVEFAARLAGVQLSEWKERTAAALDAVGLTARAKHWPAELSGGERQRVSIARVLAARPRLVLADEPTGALDHATSLMITDLLVGYAREHGASVFIATHDASVAERVDQVYRITEGRLAPDIEVRS